MSANLAIAQTISEQIGHRAFLMMGTRHKLADGPALLFDVRGSHAFNKVRVELDPCDTYTVTFYKVRGVDIIAQHSEPGVYNDMLNAIIAKHTGLSLSL